MSKEAPGVIPVSDAKRIGKDRSCPIIVIFAIEELGNRFTVTTYGRTKKLCKLAASFGEQFSTAVLNGTVEPPQTEPSNCPTCGREW